MKKILQSDVWAFVLLLAAGCLLSAWLCHENDWDLTNYHYYNAWAFLENRLNYDIVPASVQTFFNPLADLPFYYLVEYFNDKPHLVYGIQGIWFGLLLFVFYKICRLFFDVTTWVGKAEVVVALLLGATGFSLWFQIGATTNEVPLALAVLTAFYFLLKEIYNSEQHLSTFAGCGLLLGIALGLKPTVIVYCAALGICLMVFYQNLQKPLKMILFFVVGGVIGYLGVNGWWMWKLWHLYGNPFFPFLNGIFHSPYFDDFNYRDSRYLPSGVAETLFFPYLWWNKKPVAEVFFFDLRIPLLYTIGLLSLPIVLRRGKIVAWCKKYPLWSFLVAFTVISYVLWMLMFAIIRYLIAVEMLAALLLVKCAVLCSPKVKNSAIIIYWTAVIFVLQMLLRVPLDSFNFGERKYDDKVIALEDVNLPANTLLKLYNFPSAAVAAVWGKNVPLRALGYMQYNVTYMQGSDFAERGKFRQMRDAIEAAHKGPVVVVYRENFNRVYAKKIQDMLKKDNLVCEKLETNLDNNLHICLPRDMKEIVLQPRRK